MHILSLKSIDWSFENINLKISSCFLITAHLNIYENLSNKILSKNNEGLKAIIDGSSLGYLKAENVSLILIRNSNITERNMESNSSSFVLHNSNMTILNSALTNNSIKFNSSEPTLLKASGNSSIIFLNCNVSGNIGYKYIIQVSNQSSIRFINSDISYNRILNVSFHPQDRSIVRIIGSSVSIMNCIFTQNKIESARNGGAVLWISVNFSMHLESSTFTKNQGISLSAGARTINITNCYIAENNSLKENIGTFSPVGTNVYMSNCTFFKNYADDGGAVCSWRNSTLYLKNCIFKENKAFTAGTFDTGGSRAHFENCTFIANEGILHTGAISGQSYSHLVIRDCLFKDNRGINGVGAVGAEFQSKLTIWNSTFINNTSGLRAGAVLIEKDGEAYISESTFINNSAVHHGCINANSNVTFQISRTLFVSNNATNAAVLYSEYNVRLQVVSSTFEDNAGENTIEVRQNSSLIIIDCQFSENNVSSGSVIFVYLNSNVATRNSTFLNHSTELHGTVIYGSQNSNITLVESKLCHNQANMG